MMKLFTDATVAPMRPAADRGHDVGDAGAAGAERDQRRDRPQRPASGEHRRHAERRGEQHGDAERAPDHRQRAVALLQRARQACTRSRTTPAPRGSAARRASDRRGSLDAVMPGQRDQDRAEKADREADEHRPRRRAARERRWRPPRRTAAPRRSASRPAPTTRAARRTETCMSGNAIQMTPSTPTRRAIGIAESAGAPREPATASGSRRRCGRRRRRSARPPRALRR